MHSRKKGGRDTGLFPASRLLFLRLTETVSTPGQPPLLLFLLTSAAFASLHPWNGVGASESLHLI